MKPSRLSEFLITVGGCATGWVLAELLLRTFTL